MRQTLRPRSLYAALVRVVLCAGFLSMAATAICAPRPAFARERVSINAGWRFQLGDPAGTSHALRYDVRPEVKDSADGKAADAIPEAAEKIAAPQGAVLKPWILPTGNPFILDPARRHQRPAHHDGTDALGWTAL